MSVATTSVAGAKTLVHGPLPSAAPRKIPPASVTAHTVSPLGVATPTKSSPVGVGLAQHQSPFGHGGTNEGGTDASALPARPSGLPPSPAPAPAPSTGST